MWITLAVIVGVLLVIQLVASPIARAVANRKLAQMEGFTGHVETVRLALWRNRIEIENFVLHERDHPEDLPVVRVPKMAMSGALTPLLRGKLGGRALIEGAEVNIVKREAFDGPLDALNRAKAEAKEHEAQARRWEQALREALPLELSRLELRDGRMRFVDRVHQPQVDVALSRMHLVATGLRNRPDAEGAPLKVNIEGVTTGDGQLKIFVQGDPMARPLEFFTTFELKDLQLPAANTFMQAYAGADVSRGTFDLYTEATAEGGGYHGYVKPFLSDLEFETVSDENKSLGERVKETAISAVTAVLKNDDTEKVATQTPFSGRFTENDVDLWAAVENLLRNAFVQALREGLGTPDPRRAQ